MNRSSSLMQAALLLNALPKPQAAMVISRLQPSDITTVLEAVGRIDHSSAGLISETIERFASETRRWRDIQHHELHLKTAGDQLQEVLERPESPIEQQRSRRPFEFLIKIDPVIRCHLLQDEHPKNVAIVLASLPPEIASETLKGLDDYQLRISVLKRLCELDDAPAAVIHDLQTALQHRLKKLRQHTQGSSRGLDKAVDLLSCTEPGAREALITHISQIDPELAVKLQRSVFGVERLLTLTDDEIRVIHQHVDSSAWAPALKHASPELRDKILSCLQPPADQQLREELGAIGFVDNGLQELSRQNIVQTVMQLAREGKIELRKNGPRDGRRQRRQQTNDRPQSLFPPVSMDPAPDAAFRIN